MRIHFYMPEHCLPPLGERAAWISEVASPLAQFGKAASAQAWIYRTFLNLSKAGVEVELCHQIPKEGVVVALTGNLLHDFLSPKGVFLIGVVADGLPHPACHFHILQNARHAERLPRSTYIPHWPQPGIVPRNQERRDKFENLLFCGDFPNLASELRDASFSEHIKSRLGLTLVIAGSDRWHDYSEADCVIAIRGFGSRGFLGKPATKLYNAWMAGVPFIGGSDSAFESEGREGIDYLKCTAPENVTTALACLKDDPDRRRRMVAAGESAARRFTPDEITRKWSKLLHSIATQEAPSHLAKPKVMREMIRWSQSLSVNCDRLRGGY